MKSKTLLDYVRLTGGSPLAWTLYDLQQSATVKAETKKEAK